VPAPSAVLISYGIPQDEAARTNGLNSAQDLASAGFSSAGTNFTFAFPPLSLSLLKLAPAAPTLNAFAATPGEIALQLSGQPGASYLLQSSNDLRTWTTVSTNRLLGAENTLSINPPATAERLFWRAVWEP
jgi:hypothetical protein